jgi:hypothetical protein
VILRQSFVLCEPFSDRLSRFEHKNFLRGGQNFVEGSVRRVRQRAFGPHPTPFDHPEAAQRLASRRLLRKTCPKERSLPYDACQRSSAGQEKHRSEEEDRFESRKGPASAHVDNSAQAPPSETNIHGFLSIYDSKPFF